MSDLPAFLQPPPPRARRPVAAASSAPVRPAAGRVPGEAGLWVLLLGDMTVFALFFGAYLVARGGDPAGFAEAGSALSPGLGVLNTLVLLTSSLFVASAVRAFRLEGGERDARRFVALTLACAAAFLAVKGLEWAELLGAGDTPERADFFMYYFAITGVHALHLVVGVGALALLWRTVRRPARRPRDELVVECAAGYWHMVDLLWLLIFPLLYMAAA
ncbi:cytochrome c oxidase subunit 3 [Conexibacter sp. SYSU D00693]|uniref:cytochrome c oxidase subunit 3 n=1 Tax=Conexibacter sp. SYSU D00693 TaxID=2812560 RepID=UPI00196B52FC|nr:cytochrome c oxidase subunit 3 [Conexibacter sp. SYSU D00693]